MHEGHQVSVRNEIALCSSRVGRRSIRRPETVLLARGANVRLLDQLPQVALGLRP